MILLNTPHDPAGKVLTRKETETIAGVLKGFNLLAVADEVVRSVIPAFPYNLTPLSIRCDFSSFNGEEYTWVPAGGDDYS